MEGSALLMPEFGTHASTVTIEQGGVLNETDQVRVGGGSHLDLFAGSQLTTGTLQIGNSMVAGEAVVTVTTGSSMTVTALNIGSGSNAPGRLVLDGTATVGPGGATIAPSGTLSGSGLLMGGLNNAGHISPGVIVGRLQVAGPYTQAPTGILDIQIGGEEAGTTFDQLDSIGAVLSGQLNVSLISNFNPSLGSSFTIIQAESISGTFSAVNLPTLPGGRSFNVVYSQFAVTLVTVPGPASLGLFGLVGLMARRRRR
jgi:hypothetical protein